MADQLPDNESRSVAYEGMTVNERLFAARLLGNWDKAVIAKDRKTMIELLMSVRFTQQSAGQIVDAVLATKDG